MNPWWLRPTADSKEDQAPKKDDERDGERADEREEEPAGGKKERAAPEPPAEKAETAEPAEAPKRRRSSRPRRPSRDEDAPGPGEGAGAKADAGEAAQPAEAPPPAAPKRPARKREARPKEGKPKQAQSGRSRARKEKDKPQEAGVPTHDITADEIVSISRELSAGLPEPESIPERTLSVNDERKIALFCDLENIALGVRDSDIKKFDITLVLERLLEKGKIIVKRAYCDWERYSEYKRAFHESAIEMLDIPQKYYSGKNSADIKMVVDALDLCYAKEHLDTFVLLSGDSDFSPLVSKLRENDKYVIGVGVKNSSSALLVDNCDEFIYYEDIWRDRQKAPQLAGVNKKTAEAFSLMTDAIQALLRENKDVLWGSMVKQTMQRKKPSFNEGYYGYGSFSELLEDAQKKNVVKIKKDQRSGSYVVTGFAAR